MTEVHNKHDTHLEAAFIRAVVDASEKYSLRGKVVDVGIPMSKHTSVQVCTPYFLMSKSRMTKFTQPNIE